MSSCDLVVLLRPNNVDFSSAEEKKQAIERCLEYFKNSKEDTARPSKEQFVEMLGQLVEYLVHNLQDQEGCLKALELIEIIANRRNSISDARALTQKHFEALCSLFTSLDESSKLIRLKIVEMLMSYSLRFKEDCLRLFMDNVMLPVLLNEDEDLSDTRNYFYLVLTSTISCPRAQFAGSAEKFIRGLMLEVSKKIHVSKETEPTDCLVLLSAFCFSHEGATKMLSKYPTFLPLLFDCIRKDSNRPFGKLSLAMIEHLLFVSVDAMVPLMVENEAIDVICKSLVEIDMDIPRKADIFRILEMLCFTGSKKNELYQDRRIMHVLLEMYGRPCCDRKYIKDVKRGFHCFGLTSGQVKCLRQLLTLSSIRTVPRLGTVSPFRLINGDILREIASRLFSVS